MEEEIYVSCHAPSLSLLLFETARSFHDQKGLLIGQICNEIIPKKTDENEVNCEHKTAIYLEHCIPIDDQDIIGNAGSVNKSKLQKFTNVLQNKIVGWYSFRRNSRLFPNSLSELLIHQSLLELVPSIKSEYFVACFMSSNTAANMSTHTFNHVFMTFEPNKARFKSLRLKIYTLSDKSVNSNGYLMKNPFPTSRSFEKIINHIQKEEAPVKSVLEIHEKISELLKYINKKLQNADSHRIQLEHEIETLKKKIGEKKKGNIFVEEPEQRELKIKTIVYNPNIKYGSTAHRNSVNSDPIKPLISSSAYKEKFEAEPRKNDRPEDNTSNSSTTKVGVKDEQQNNSPLITSQILWQSMSSVNPKAGNIVINNDSIQNSSCTNESREQKISDYESVQQSKSMEY